MKLPLTAYSPKRVASAQAEAALLGASLSVIDADDGTAEFVLSRNALTRRFAELADVEEWLHELQSVTA